MNFKDDFDRIMNSPINTVKKQVIAFMSTDNYKRFAEGIQPIDRAAHIYSYDFERLTEFYQSIKDFSLLNDDEAANRYKLLMDGMALIHSYLSAQFSLLDILKTHAERLPEKNILLAERKKLIKLQLTKFLSDLRNNILHQISFGTTLQFKSEWGHCKIVYQVPELLKSAEWSNSQNFILACGDNLIIEDLIVEYHNYMMAFLNRYEGALFSANTVLFSDVIKTLLNFAKQYNEIGQNGFLPVTKAYLVEKLKFLPEEFQ